MDKQFKNRVVLITGGSGGIGKATALEFAKQGAKVSIGDVDDRAAETVNEIEKMGGEALYVKTDVTSAKDVENLVKKTTDTFGGLDHVFNNSGILNKPNKLADITEEEFDQVIDVDLKGVFLSMKYELKYMVENGGGTIVNTSSVAGLITDPQMAPYVAAKHGVAGLSKSAGFDYAVDNIRVNAVAPGLTETAMTQGWKDDSEKWKEVTSNVPMQRAAKPEEIAKVVVFLSSDAASFVNAQVYPVDGGQTSH